MASHRKSALSLPMLGQVLPPPPARLTPQIRRLNCTWWRCKHTHHEASSWRLVASEFLGGWKRGCRGRTRFREQPSTITNTSKFFRLAARPGLTHTSPKMWTLGKAAGDSPRSPPTAAPFETKHCHLTSHLPQMWQERSSGSFSHKFLPNRHSRFPRQANAVTALQTASCYPEQNCFSGQTGEHPQSRGMQDPQKQLQWSTHVEELASLPLSHGIDCWLGKRGDRHAMFPLCSLPECNLVLCSMLCWLGHEHISATGGKLL